MHTSITTKGRPRQLHRYKYMSDYSECARPLKALVAAGFKRDEVAFELTRRGIRTPVGGPTWSRDVVRRAVNALGLKP